MADRRGGVALLTDPTVASLLKTGTRGPGESPSPEEFGWASPAAHLALVRACFLLLLQRRGLFGERSSEQAWGHVFGDAPSLQDEDLLAALALLPESALPGTVDDLAGLHQVLLADQLVPVGFVSDEETATPVGNRRRQQGAFYTPPPLAAWLVEQCLAAQVLDRRPEALLVCDPACGGGVILTAALRFLRGAAEPQTDPRVLASNLHGVDIDPVAAELTRMAIWLELGDETLSLVQAAPNVRVGDSLLHAPMDMDFHGRSAATDWLSGRGVPVDAAPLHWPLEFPHQAERGFDACIGNPPFLAGTRRHTARSQARGRVLRDNGYPIGAFTDTSAVFAALCGRLVRNGGTVGLVMPQAFLAASHARAVRSALTESGRLRSLWLSQGMDFEAAVDTCAFVWRRCPPRRSEPDKVERYTGNPPTSNGWSSGQDLPTWSGLWADLRGVPRVGPRDSDLSGLLSATADFRDQYYGLLPHIVEHEPGMSDDEYPPIITAGLIGAGELRWGRRSTRLGKRAWRAPRVDLAALRERDPRLGAWADTRLVPKILVAAQGRVIEVVVDEAGCWLPSVPVITATVADTDLLWTAAASLSSPGASAYAATHAAGAGLTATSIRLTARQLVSLPIALVAAGKQFARLQLASSGGQQIAAVDDSALDHGARRSRLLADFAKACEPRRDVRDWWLGQVGPKPP